VYRALLEASRDLKLPSSVFSDALAIADSGGLKAMEAVHVAIVTHHRCGRFVSTDPHFRWLKLLTPHWIELDAG
jgi:predicted nucleic acid-binding protein